MSDIEQLRRELLAKTGLRVGEQTLAYIAARLNTTKAPRSFPVFAQDARTGMPTRGKIDPAMLTTGESQQGMLF